MPNKKVALLQNDIVQNIAVWDGISEWDVIGYTEADLIGAPNIVRMGQAFHNRQGNPYTHNIVIDGNSLAVGTSGGTTKATEKCVIDAGLTQWDFINMARDGYTTPGLTAAAPNKIDCLYESALGTKNILIIWEGINDIALTPSNDTTAYNNLKTYCQARKAVGWKIIVGTLTPRNGGAANQETYRLSVNTMIRDAKAANETWLDAVADVGSDATLSDSTNRTYYGDGLHPTPAGHAIAATYFTTAINLLK